MRTNGYHQSVLFSAYNYCKHYGRKTGLWTRDRVDRALSYLMTGEAEAKWAEYQSTFKSCECPDSQYRKVICKHSLSKMIDEKYRQLCEAEGWTP